MEDKIDSLKNFIKKEYFEPLEKSGVYFWIAGGVLRDFYLGNSPKDIDIFLSSEADRKKLIDYCYSNLNFDWFSSGPLHREYIDLEGRRWQFLFLGGPAVPNMINTITYFDYTINFAAIDSQLNLCYSKNYFEDIENKKLHYTGNCYHVSHARPEVAISRLKKYRERGFSFSHTELTKWLKYNEERWPYVSGQKDWEPMIREDFEIISIPD